MIQWKYKGKILKEPPEGSEGFIYMITYNDGTKYIGKKSFWSRRRTNVKGKLRKKLVTKESDWVTYRGSSELGKQKATAGLIDKLTILHLCDSKGCLMYLEVVEMIKRRVLCDETYLNANILLKIYKCYEPMEV